MSAQKDVVEVMTRAIDGRLARNGMSTQYVAIGVRALRVASFAQDLAESALTALEAKGCVVVSRDALVAIIEHLRDGDETGAYAIAKTALEAVTISRGTAVLPPGIIGVEIPAGSSSGDCNMPMPILGGGGSIEPKGGWQPIETAKKDGRFIDGYNAHNGERHVCRWIEPQPGGLTEWPPFDGQWGNHPTHWKPLPLPSLPKG